jgi:hypothetical protein
MFGWPQADWPRTPQINHAVRGLTGNKIRIGLRAPVRIAPVTKMSHSSCGAQPEHLFSSPYAPPLSPSMVRSTGAI